MRICECRAQLLLSSELQLCSLSVVFRPVLSGTRDSTLQYSYGSIVVQYINKRFKIQDAAPSYS